MLTHEENELLCRVEGDAPMGQIMRRHWIPACLSEELPEADGAPVPVRLLGEDLVAFRDTEGKIGLIDRYCPHRRASLVLGRNEESGLRCLYHGWKMDVEGNVVEMPSEPVESCMAQKVRQKAYPTHEHGGIVWTYMGPADTMPAFEPPAFAPSEDTRVSITKIEIDCNWAQVLEGNIDSAHSSSLHSSEIRPGNVARSSMSATVITRPSTDKAPRIQVESTSYGFRYAALRRPIKDAATHDYVRMTVFIAPFTVLIPPNTVYNVANMNVPVDDTHTTFYFISWSDTPGKGVGQEQWRKRGAAQVGIDLDQRYRKKGNADNNYLQDRQAMKNGSFTGIRGVPNQDIAMWETMGPIADRSRELLGASDIAIVQFRRLMVEAAAAFRDGAPAIGAAQPRTPHAGIRSYEGVAPKTTDWRTLA